MSDENEVRLGHQNLIEYSRAATQWASKGSLHQDRTALLYAGGSWIPVVGNGAFRTDDAAEPYEFPAPNRCLFLPSQTWLQHQGPRQREGR